MSSVLDRHYIFLITYQVFSTISFVVNVFTIVDDISTARSKMELISRLYRHLTEWNLFTKEDYEYERQRR